MSHEKMHTYFKSNTWFFISNLENNVVRFEKKIASIIL